MTISQIELSACTRTKSSAVKHWPIFSVALVAWTPLVYAHGSAVGDFDSPLARGLYVMLPVPYVLFGLIAWLLYRARRRQGTQTRDAHKSDNIGGRVR